MSCVVLAGGAKGGGRKGGDILGDVPFGHMTGASVGLLLFVRTGALVPWCPGAPVPQCSLFFSLFYFLPGALCLLPFFALHGAAM